MANYKRKQITGSMSPMDIKFLNDNFQNIWLMMNGNLTDKNMIDTFGKDINISANNSIVLKVGKDEFNAAIEVLDDKIALKVGTEDFNSIIKIMQDNINLKVGTTDFNSQINMLKDSIALKASKIELNGVVEFTNGVDTKATNASSTANSALNTANSASSTASSAYSTASSALSGLSDRPTKSDLTTLGKTTINGGNILTDTVSLSCLKSNNSQPVIKLFDNCSIDARSNDGTAQGTALRLQWDKSNYFFVNNGTCQMYINGLQTWVFNTTSAYNGNTGAIVITSQNIGSYIPSTSGIISVDAGATQYKIRTMEMVKGSPTFLEIASDLGSFGADVWASDIKFKENVLDSTISALDKVNAIEHKSFDHTLNDNYIECGYIAQQLKEVNSEWVMEVPQSDGGTIMQPMASTIIPYLSKAIQEQQKMINELQSRIDTLENKLLEV